MDQKLLMGEPRNAEANKTIGSRSAEGMDGPSGQGLVILLEEIARALHVQPAPNPSKSRYKIEPRGKTWQSFGTCRLLISVGQPYHEDKKLMSLVDWINLHTGDPFKECEVIVGDSLQRFNIMAMGTPKAVEAFEQAVTEGTRWLERNSTVLQFLRVRHRVIRWDEVRLDTRFPSMWERMDYLFQKDPALRSALQADTQTLLARRLAHGDQLDSEVFTICCREYLIEELAGLALLESDSPAATFYPGSWARVWQAARESESTDMPHSLRSLAAVELRLRLRHSARSTSS
jgi:tRNA-dependent cyclodipeptide synthase